MKTIKTKKYNQNDEGDFGERHEKMRRYHSPKCPCGGSSHSLGFMGDEEWHQCDKCDYKFKV